MLFYNIVIAAVEDYQRKDLETKLSTDATVVAGSISKTDYLFAEGNRAILDQDIDAKSREGQYRIMVFDDRGVVLKDTNRTDTGKTLLVPEVIEALQRNSRVNTRVHEKATYAASAIINAESQKVGAVLLTASTESTYETIMNIRQTMLLFIGLTFFVLGVLVFFVSKYFLNPLKTVLRTVRRMSDGHMGQRIRVRGHDEFWQLGEAFNAMSEKLEQVEKTRDEFVSNVSHELKTPLSSIKVLTESILLQENVPIETYTEFLQDINSEIDRMTYLVNDLLSLVKLDQREMLLNVKPLEMNTMVEDILKRLSPLADQKGIDLLYEDVRKVVADVDEVKMSLAISNLVENGIKYTPRGGTVKVIVDADHQNAFVTVKDTGIGISEEDQGKVFNRFYRVDKTRDRETGGTGLGLAITHATVLLHNGSVRLNSKESDGSTFIVRVPIHYNR